MYATLKFSSVVMCKSLSKVEGNNALLWVVNIGNRCVYRQTNAVLQIFSTNALYARHSHKKHVSVPTFDVLNIHTLHEQGFIILTLDVKNVFSLHEQSLSILTFMYKIFTGDMKSVLVY